MPRCEINSSPAVADKLLPAVVRGILSLVVDPYFEPWGGEAGPRSTDAAAAAAGAGAAKGVAEGPRGDEFFERVYEAAVEGSAPEPAVVDE